MQSAEGEEDGMCVTVDSSECDETAEKRRESGEKSDGGKMGDERQRRRLSNLLRRDDIPIHHSSQKAGNGGAKIGEEQGRSKRERSREMRTNESIVRATNNEKGVILIKLQRSEN
jgi:hypothetical protein